jgi:hypothetical protein
VPGGGLFGTSGVESGKAAPLVGGPPGVELHMVVDELPSGDIGDMVPVVLPTIGVGMVANGGAGIIAADDIAAVDGVCMGVVVIVDVEEVADPAGTAVTTETDDIVPVVPPVAGMDVTGTAAVPGAICPVGVEQVTTVAGVVGSEASGTGANVVSGVPGRVVAENGLGPLSGDVTIVPGVDARPMAVVPMVEICARPASQPASRTAVVNSKRRIAIPSLVKI